MIYLVLAIASTGVLASCSSSSPGKAAKQYMEYLAEGEYDKLVDGLYFGEDASKEDIEKSKAMMKAILMDKGRKSLEEKGGLKDIEVVSEEISPDGKSATVTLKQTFGNGETEEDDTDLVLVNGKWMMEMKK